jgi:hypothetical protein
VEEISANVTVVTFGILGSSERWRDLRDIGSVQIDYSAVNHAAVTGGAATESTRGCCAPPSKSAQGGAADLVRGSGELRASPSTFSFIR